MSSSIFTTNDGTQIYYKDWGVGQPVVFHHGWPLSSDDWDTQMLFFLAQGYRVIAHDRRGHGRSSQTATGNDMDTYATDVAFVRNWWRQGMMGGSKALYDCIKAFSETDFTEDLKAIDVPVLMLHGDDDQVVPVADSALLAAKLVKDGTLKVYPGLPHGMCTTHSELINRDLLAFFRRQSLSASPRHEIETA